MTPPLRVVVLASGSGSNFQALLDRFNLGEDPSARVVRLIASAPEIGALDRARSAEVDAVVVEEADLARTLGASGADLVVLAGYLRKIPASVVGEYRGRMINIHPALLPAFGGKGMYGSRVHRAVLERGVRVTGVTVHFVDEEYDRGPIIAQWPVPVREGDDPETLAARVLRVEHRVLPRVVHAFATDEFRLTDDGRCRWREPWFRDEAFTLDGAPPPGSRDHEES